MPQKLRLIGEPQTGWCPQQTGSIWGDSYHQCLVFKDDPWLGLPHLIWNMVKLLDVTTSAQIDHKIFIQFLMALGVANAWKLLAQWLFEVCGLSTTTVCLQDAMVGWTFCETCHVPFRRSLGKCMILPLVISPNHFWRSHSCLGGSCKQLPVKWAIPFMNLWMDLQSCGYWPATI